MLLLFFAAEGRKKREELPVYEQGENVDNPLRCPVKLYEFYVSKWSVRNFLLSFYFNASVLAVDILYRPEDDRVKTLYMKFYCQTLNNH